jgi:hypothetical protein
MFLSKHALVKYLQASDIIQIILDHGKLRSGDILSLLSAYDAKSMLVLLIDEFKDLTCFRKKPLYTNTLQAGISVIFKTFHDSFPPFAEGQSYSI